MPRIERLDKIVCKLGGVECVLDWLAEAVFRGTG